MGISDHPPDTAEVAEDARIMGETIGRLQAENNDLQTRLAASQRLHSFSSFVSGLAALIFISGLVGFIGFPVWKCYSTPYRVSGCYIERKSVGSGDDAMTIYKLIGHVEWHADANEGAFLTFDDAVAGAKKAGCSLMGTP